MALSKRLFREAALERLSSPEQLDQQLQVTSPKGWIALVAMWVLLAAVIAWSVLGRVYTKEEGQGILVTAGGPKVPPPLLDQLALGGRLVGPFGPPDEQRLVRIRKHGDGRMTRELLGRCRFVELVGSHGWMP